jgi:hypothetical protein
VRKSVKKTIVAIITAALTGILAAGCSTGDNITCKKQDKHSRKYELCVQGNSGSHVVTVPYSVYRQARVGDSYSSDSEGHVTIGHAGEGHGGGFGNSGGHGGFGGGGHGGGGGR